MKVLLDEILPAGVAGLLPDHEVTTVQRAGFKGLTNGVLLRRAAASGYVVLLTADRNLPAQQNVTASGIALVLVRGSRMSEVAGQATQIKAAVAGAQPGTVTRVEPG
jgi:predicted nuclease of predicted toxin-antitoxin system